MDFRGRDLITSPDHRRKGGLNEVQLDYDSVLCELFERVTTLCIVHYNLELNDKCGSSYKK